MEPGNFLAFSKVPLTTRLLRALWNDSELGQLNRFSGYHKISSYFELTTKLVININKLITTIRNIYMILF
jgi:hypothetical protein